MTVFTQLFGSDRLYTAGPGSGTLLLVLPAAGPQTIDLATAWSSPAFAGNFVFSAADPGITAGTASAFVTAITNYVNSAFVARAFLWLSVADAWQQGTLTKAPLMGMTAGGSSLQTGLSAPLVSSVSLFVQNGSTLALSGTDVTIGGTVSFTGDGGPSGSATQGTLALDGPSRGTIAFPIFLTRLSLHDNASWGFQFVCPASAGVVPTMAEWLPLAAGTGGGSLGFNATIDPSDPVNATLLRSMLVFTGVNDDDSPTTLASAYRTTTGLPVTLIPATAGAAGEPAALVFTGGSLQSPTVQAYQLAPMGDFILSLGSSPPATGDLLCGLHGTESITFEPQSAGYAGDRLRFTPYQPAFAPRYPFPNISPVGPPVDVNALLLDSTYTTSWATVVRAPAGSGAIPYTAQPKGAALYGQDPLVWPLNTSLMGWMDPADTLPQNVAFPLVPYAGVDTESSGTTFPPAQIADFERQVVGPTRRRLIGTGSGKAPNRMTVLRPGTQDSGPFNTTTPTGLIATVDGGNWTRLLLGQNLEANTAMYFCNLTPELQQAFQTGQLFLVLANNECVGDFASSGTGSCAAGAAQFFNTMSVGGWTFAANTGANNRYADYRNVIIVKGRQGKLWDQSSPTNSLVSNPDKWTQKDVLGAPSDLVQNPTPPPAEVLQPPNPAELVILSQWLQTYFADAATAADSDYYAIFNAIAQDDNWTGILILRMDITAVPDDLAGITAGIQDLSRFSAHHLGIQISNVTNAAPPDGVPGPWLDQTSSMFGLIDYVDPAFTPPAAGQRPQAIPPGAGTAYDFQLLSLKVLFRNTAVESFNSYAQLTVTDWFDMPVDHMGPGGNAYAAIVLSGSFQNNGGQPVYSLSSAADNAFYFVNDAISKIEVTSAIMSTRDAGDAGPGEAVVSWFSLSGFIDFKIVQAVDGTDTYAFDIFSFGNAAGADVPRQGLAFSNLGVLMSFPKDDPTSRLFTFAAGDIRFDVGTSTPRAGSLFQEFGLELQALTGGTADMPPSTSGFADVITTARLTGVDGGPWWGLRYQLNMGTPGNLAGKVGLTSQLLTAWAPTASGTRNSYDAALGLQLPGTGGGANLISLQTVLELSIGQIWLQYDRTNDAFLLLLTEIALKIFGLLSIPPGSTLFYLYANPDTSGVSTGLAWYAMYRKGA